MLVGLACNCGNPVNNPLMRIDLGDGSSRPACTRCFLQIPARHYCWMCGDDLPTDNYWVLELKDEHDVPQHLVRTCLDCYDQFDGDVLADREPLQDAYPRIFGGAR